MYWLNDFSSVDSRIEFARRRSIRIRRNRRGLAGKIFGRTARGAVVRALGVGAVATGGLLIKKRMS